MSEQASRVSINTGTIAFIIALIVVIACVMVALFGLESRNQNIDLILIGATALAVLLK